MQSGKFKLHEIIWEITGRCENKCSYCGSRDVWDDKINIANIIKIAEKIASCPPEEVNVSGGDPLLVDASTHACILKLLQNKKVVCKIIVNPKSFRTDGAAKMKVVSLYDWIGVSINEEEDFKIGDLKFPEKVTAITNFNIDNVFLFDEIENFISNRLPSTTIWQIQYTMFHKAPDSKKAIYNNVQAHKYLTEKMTKSSRRIVVADNMNCGICGAGTQGIGILSNGDVVPCMSMRDWHEELEKEVQGNILHSSLKEIWQTKFQKYRFEEFKCCKDVCKNKPIELCKDDTTRKLDELSKTFILPGKPGGGKYPKDAVFVYGAFQDSVRVYAVTQVPRDFNIRMVYSVVRPNDITDGEGDATGTQV